MAFGPAAEFAGTGVTVNIVVPGGPTDTPMVPAVAPYERANLISPAAMAPPMTWIIGTAGDEITAPMVGTFYEASSPEAGPFISIGDTISEGQTLCIIEAMKVMNEIKSETSGTITAIVAKDGEPVQFGDALFRVQ